MKTESLSLKGVLFILVIMASLFGFVSNGNAQSTWSFVTIPGLPSGATLKRLWTDQSGNLYVWASTNAPDAFLFHWDGTSWSQVLNLPNHDVNIWRGQVFGTGPSDVFASAFDNTNLIDSKCIIMMAYLGPNSHFLMKMDFIRDSSRL